MNLTGCLFVMMEFSIERLGSSPDSATCKFEMGQELHESMGHLGHERVYSLAPDRCCWPFMGRDIEHFIRKVCRCVKQKRPVLKVRDPLQQITSTAPFDLISIDFLHLDQSSGGYEYIMLIVDHFTKFVQGYAT